jgi:hypothetical protein
MFGNKENLPAPGSKGQDAEQMVEVEKQQEAGVEVQQKPISEQVTLELIFQGLQEMHQIQEQRFMQLRHDLEDLKLRFQLDKIAKEDAAAAEDSKNKKK